MATTYEPKDAELFAQRYRNIQAGAGGAELNSGELAWKKPLRSSKTVGVRDGDQLIEEGAYKNWEPVNSSDPSAQYQTLPEDHGNKASIIGQTPSASVYFRKKYFRSLAATAGWTRAFQAAMTTLLINKSLDIASVEALTKYKYMYGVRDEGSGTLTRKPSSNEPVGKESNHYRAYWYGDNIGNYPGGILEITNFRDLNTGLSLTTGDMGSCSITIEDPYNLLFVSKRDIDRLFVTSGNLSDPNAEQRDANAKQIEGLRTQIQELRSFQSQAIADFNTKHPNPSPEERASFNAVLVENYDSRITEFESEIASIQQGEQSLLPPPISQLTSGEKIYYKRDVDYLYQYVAGRSIFSVMDELYVWMSPEKENLFSFSVVKDLEKRYRALSEELSGLSENQKKNPVGAQSLQSTTPKPPPPPPVQMTPECAQATQALDKARKEARALSAKILGQAQSENLNSINIAWLSAKGKDEQRSAYLANLVKYHPDVASLVFAHNDKLDEIDTLAEKAAECAPPPVENTPSGPAPSGGAPQTPEAKSNADAVAVEASVYAMNESRMEGISAEMDDIAGRLTMFGYKVDSSSGALTAPANASSLTGFSLLGGIQVFGGIVTNVAESWSDGVFQITISSSSNLKFLDMSRFTPAGSAIDAFGLMDTPVKFYSEQVDGKTVVRWDWLHGIYAMNGRIPGSNTRVTGADQLNAVAAGMTVLNVAYATYDAANLISQLLCGVVFDPNLQLLTSLPDEAHAYYRSSIPSLTTTPIEGDQFISTLRRIIESQNRVFGNFIPFAWVPSDILAYDTEVFPDMAYGHMAVQENIILSIPFQPADTGDKELDNLISDQIYGKPLPLQPLTTTKQLQDYLNGLGPMKSKDFPVPGSPAGARAQLSKDKKDFLDKEIAKATVPLQQAKSVSNVNGLSAFDIHDVISNYPVSSSGDTESQVADNAMKCLAYSDAQKFLLMNRREDIVRNLDQKYVVIDMTYLASIVARAYVMKIGDNLSIWTSERISQLQAFKEIVEQLEWEGFADTQGNIIYRKRQFNCIPASVYKRYIVPSVEKFINNVLKDHGNSLDQWKTDVPAGAEREKALVDNLGGVDLAWLAVYQNPYLRAQILEPDYPIDTSSNESYASELLSNGLPKETSGSSGERYHTYITDDVILNWNFSEAEPLMTRIDVTGQMDMFELPQETGIPTIMTAAVVDYDMWFHYGYRREQVTKAWIREPELQGIPFGIAALAHAKGKVLSGTVTVIGNPYYQPGEVVYIESRNMLYYVQKVAHNFSYGGDYRTTLTLEFGHYPGVWIVDPYYIATSALYGGAITYSQQDVREFHSARDSQQYKDAMLAYSGQSMGGPEKRVGTYGVPVTYTTPAGAQGSVQSYSPSARDIEQGNPPKTIPSTFDPAILDRLRAAKFYVPVSTSGAQRGMNYDGLRRNDKDGK